MGPSQHLGCSSGPQEDPYQKQKSSLGGEGAAPELHYGTELLGVCSAGKRASVVFPSYGFLLVYVRSLMGIGNVWGIQL